MKFNISRVISNTKGVTLLPVSENGIYADYYETKTENNMGIDTTQIEFYVRNETGWFFKDIEEVKIATMLLIGDFIVERA